MQSLRDTFLSCKSRSSELFPVPRRTSAQAEGVFLPDHYRFQFCQLHVIEEMRVHSSVWENGNGNVTSWPSVVSRSASAWGEASA